MGENSDSIIDFKTVSPLLSAEISVCPIALEPDIGHGIRAAVNEAQKMDIGHEIRAVENEAQKMDIGHEIRTVENEAQKTDIGHEIRAVKIEAQKTDIGHEIRTVENEAKKTDVEREIEMAGRETNEGFSGLELLDREINRLSGSALPSDYLIAAVCGTLSGRINSVIGKTRRLGYGNVKKDGKSGEDVRKSDTDIAVWGAAEGGSEPKTDTPLWESAKSDFLPRKAVSLSETESCDLQKREPLGDNCGGVESETEGELWTLSKELGEDVPKERQRLSASKGLFGLVFSVSEQFSNSPRLQPDNIIDCELTVNAYGNFVGKGRESKAFAGILNWFFTVGRDIARNGGTGITFKASKAVNTVLSLSEELSRLPCIREEGFPEKLRAAFTEYLSGVAGVRLKSDLNDIFSPAERKKGLLSGQESAVLFTETFTRACYFVRGFITEINEKHSLSLVDFSVLLPLKSRSLSRMLSVSYGTFTAVNVTRAALRAAAKGGMLSLPKFLFDMAMKVNIVGVGAFAVTLKDELALTVERERLRDEKIELCGEQLKLVEAEIFYKQAGLWQKAEDTVITLSEVSRIAERAVKFYTDSINEMTADLKDAEKEIKRIKEKSPDFFSGLDEILKYE